MKIARRFEFGNPGDVESHLQVLERNRWITRDPLRGVIAAPLIGATPRSESNLRSRRAGVTTNQGRVRSDNIAPLHCDGLVFRSRQEINLYKALCASGVPFAPLPTFIRGGGDYRRIEPDFVIIKDGVVMVVEVDGGTTHPESPAEAHERTRMLALEGAHIERVRAAECSTLERAEACASRLFAIVEKIKSNRR